MDSRRRAWLAITVASLAAGVWLVIAGGRFAAAQDSSSWNEVVHEGSKPGGGGKASSTPTSGGGTEPNPSGTAKPAGTPAPDPNLAKLEQAKKLLKETPAGAELVKYLEDNKIPISFDPSDGSYHSKGSIVLGPPFDADEMALTLVHEGHHLKMFKDGKQADVNKDTRADFIKKKISEEVQGTVNSIELKLALVKKGKTVNATFPLEDEYVKARDKAIADLKKSNPSASAADLEAAGKKAGYDAVQNGFDTGKVVSSVKVDGRSVDYTTYYGKVWDGAHPTPPPAPKP